MESEDVSKDPAGALWHPLTTARRLVAELRLLHALNRDHAFATFRERHMSRHVLATVIIGVPMLISYHAMDLALGLPGARTLLLVRMAAAAALLVAGALFFVRRSPGKDRVQLLVSLYVATSGAVLIEHFGGGSGNAYWVGFTTIQIFWLGFIPLPFSSVLLHGALATSCFALGVWALSQSTAPSLRLVESTAMLWGNFLICGGLAVLRNSEHAVLYRRMTLQRQAERLRDELVHTLVHDLKSPLTAISGSLDLMTGAGVSERDESRLLAIARANGQRMQLLVETILEVHRLESGALELAEAPVVLDELIDEATQLQGPVAELRGVALRFSVATDLPLVRIDRALVGRVLQNLLGNALKATPPGGHIVVEAEGASDTGFVTVRVRDNGPGVPAELRPRLFEKLTRGAGGGSGLGLYFCRLAVEAHGGAIGLESDKAGTTVHFTLPRSTRPDALQITAAVA